MLPNTNCTVCTYPTQRKTLEIQAYWNAVNTTPIHMS
jgi:hypothetical protein